MNSRNFGELLLKQVLWFAQRNKYDLTYLTAFPKQAFLIDLLSYYGFKETIKLPNGETVLEKPILIGAFARALMRRGCARTRSTTRRESY